MPVNNCRIAVLLILNALVTSVTAPVPSRFNGGSLPQLPNFGSDNEDLPPFTVAPFDGAYFSWTATNTSGVWTMFGMFNFTNGEYLAIGLNSDKKMNGPIVICNANSSASSATCYDYIGSLYTIQMVADNAVPVSQQATTLLAASAGGVTLIQFSKVVYDPANSVSIVNMNGFNRMIFARGKWGSLPAPIQHQSDDSYSCEVNFVTGEVVLPTSTSYRYVLYPVVGLIVGGGVLLRILNSCMVVELSNVARNVAAAAIGVCALAALIAYIMVYYRDYLVMVSPKAFFRSVGQGAAAVFCCMMLPTPRRLFMSATFRLGPDRCVPYHVAFALLFMVVTTIHGAGMWAQYGTSQIVRWRDKDTASRLPGLLAYVLCIVQVVVGMLRHRIGFLRFRVFHYLYVPIVFFVCCHATIVVYGIIPSLVLMLAAQVYKRAWRRVGEGDGSILRAHADEATRIVTIDVVNYNRVDPGAYFFITIPQISRFSHPFSVYQSRKIGQGVQVLRFRIRCRDQQQPVEHSGGHGTPSLPLQDLSTALHVSSELQTKTMEENANASLLAGIVGAGPLPSFSRQLFRMASTSPDHLKSMSIRLDGPYGHLDFFPALQSNMVLVAGGIGITSVSQLLFALADADEKAIGVAAHKIHLQLWWVVRSPAWLRLFGGELARLKQDIKKACSNSRPVFKVFVTQISQGGDLDCGLPKDITNHLAIRAGRPDFSAEVSAFEQQQTKHYLTASDANGNSFSTKDKVTFFVSGPSSLQNAFSSAVHNAENTKAMVCQVHCFAQTL